MAALVCFFMSSKEHNLDAGERAQPWYRGEAWQSPGCTEEGPALVHGGGRSPGCRPLRTQSWGQKAALDTEGGNLGRRFAGVSSAGAVIDARTHLVR